MVMVSVDSFVTDNNGKRGGSGRTRTQEAGFRLMGSGVVFIEVPACPSCSRSSSIVPSSSAAQCSFRECSTGEMPTNCYRVPLHYANYRLLANECFLLRCQRMLLASRAERVRLLHLQHVHLDARVSRKCVALRLLVSEISQSPCRWKM